MKQLLLAAGFALLAITVSTAQYTKFGFTMGSVFASGIEKYNPVGVPRQSNPGITFGLLADFPIGDKISFQPNLNLVQKRTKYEKDFGYGNFERRSTTVNYFEMPMNLLFNAFCKAGTFSIGAGPAFSFAISGKSKYEDETGTEILDLEFGNDPNNDDLKRFDFGANMLGAFRFRHGVYVAVNYNAGLSNLIPDGLNQVRLRSNYWGIKLGFSIEKKLCKKK